MKRLAIFIAVAALALAVASPAFGADAVVDGYGGQGAGVLGAVNNGDGGGNGTPSAPVTPVQPAAVSTSSGGSLPFTGLDVGLLAVGGVLLVGVGVGLRRFTHPLS